jgi:hypothetical protein
VAGEREKERGERHRESARQRAGRKHRSRAEQRNAEQRNAEQSRAAEQGRAEESRGSTAVLRESKRRAADGESLGSERERLAWVASPVVSGGVGAFRVEKMTRRLIWSST